MEVEVEVVVVVLVVHYEQDGVPNARVSSCL
jgi:hypothetical protein